MESNKEKLASEEKNVSSRLETEEGVNDMEYEDGIEKSPNQLFKLKVNDVLQKLADRTAGEFAASGKLADAPMVIISIKNSEEIDIRCPLYEDEAEKIIRSFQQSPFGKGSETIVDTSVRNSWQLDPQGFEILNPAWNTYVNDVLLPRIGNEMLIDSSFKASLYKLLLYKTGSFFKPHRDSEKEDGMFATLVIQLPSKYDGGQMVIKHDSKVKTVDFSSTDENNREFSTYFSVFYCDCKHEILPITNGLRLCLVYNLVCENSTSIPMPPDRNSIEMELKSLFQNWDNPGLLVYAFKHKYSEKNLSIENLKTTDKTVAILLQYLAQEIGLHVYFAQLEKASEGKADGDEEEGFHNEEEIDFDSDNSDYCETKTYTLKKLMMVSGHVEVTNSTLTVDLEEHIMPEDCFKTIDPYMKTQRPTGNEGVDVSKFYRSTAMVFWPKKCTLKILTEASVSAPVLFTLFLKEVEVYLEGPKDNESTEQLLSSAKTIVNSDYKKSDGSFDIPMLTALMEINDLTLLKKYFNKMRLDNTTLLLVVDQCDAHGWDTFSESLTTMFKNVPTRKESLELLNALIGNGNLDDGKENVFRCILQEILGKFKHRVGILKSLTFLDPQSRFMYESFKEAERSIVVGSQENDMKAVVEVAEKLNFNKLALLQILYGDFIIITSPNMMTEVIKNCQMWRWESFSAQLPNMFERINKSSEAVDYLDMLVGNCALDMDQREVCCGVLKVVLEKLKIKTPGRGANPALLTEEQKNSQLEGDLKLLYKVCNAARQVKYNLMEFMKGKPIKAAVPVLIQLAHSTGKLITLQGDWLEIATHFIGEMEKQIAQKAITPTWKLNVNPSCTCRDCTELNSFLKSDVQSRGLKMGNERRRHVHKQLNTMKDLVHETDREGGGILVVTKTVKTGQDQLNIRNTALDLLPKLRVVTV